MRLDYPGAAKPAPYDRDPGVIFINYHAVVGPHGTTTRWSHTVPVGKKAILNMFEVGSVRATAAAPAAQAVQGAEIAGVASYVAVLYGNNVDDGRIISASPQALLLAGDVLNGITEDLSTGGTIYTITGAMLTEFNEE